MSERYLDLTELALVPGPLTLLKVFSSVELWETEYYSPEEIAAAILAYPGTRLLHGEEPSWEEWQARWECGGRYIELDLFASDVDPAVCGGYDEVWGGSSLRTHCTLDDLLAFWQAVRVGCPGVWLHDAETMMWSPETFSREVFAFRERTPQQAHRRGWGRL